MNLQMNTSYLCVCCCSGVLLWSFSTKIMALSCKKLIITRNQKGEEYPTCDKKRKANWIGHILRMNYLLKHVTEGKINGRLEVTGRRGMRLKQLLDDLKDSKGCRKVEEETLDLAVRRTCFKRIYGLVIRQTTICSGL